MPAGNVSLLIGDVRDQLRTISPRSVQTCITSPPYWGLRDYGVAGQIGSEKTPEEFIAIMVDVFRLVRDTLRDDGTLWLNLGDSYAQDTKWGGTSGGKHAKGLHGSTGIGRNRTNSGLPPGSQCLMPHRVAMALQADGWILRSTVIWCLSGGSWLYARTVKGDAPAMLKDLARLDPATVQLWNGSKWTRVVSWTQNKPPKKAKANDKREGFLEIEFRNGERVGCTAEHHWPTNRGLLQAKDIRVGDVVPVCTLPEPRASRLALSESELGWIVGFYLAEGHVTDKGVTFSVHESETLEFERIREMVLLLDGTATMRATGEHGATITVYSQTFKALMQEYVSGASCKTKRLTRKAWMRSNMFLRGLMDGYLDGDGHRDEKNNRWHLGFTNNDGLAVDLRTASARLGYVCRLKRIMSTCQTGPFPAWKGELRKTVSDHHNTRPSGEVVAIRKSRARGYWDVEVADEPHLFAMASGILTHNCKRSPMPESVSGWKWVPCRVKNGRQVVTEGGLSSWDMGEHSHGPASGEYRGQEKTVANWVPCPGCDKCRDNGGLILRQGKWRPTTAHEYLFLFSKSAKYYADGEAVAELASYGTHSKGSNSRKKTGQQGSEANNDSFNAAIAAQVETRNPRSVWTLSHEPYKEAHFATFPSELVRRCLLATTPADCCSACGMGYAPVVVKERIPTRPGTDAIPVGDSGANRDPQRHIQRTVIEGYRPTCRCAAPAGRSLVLDPFAGSGTTLQVARHYGRDSVGIELSETYAAMAHARIEKTPRCAVVKEKRAKKRLVVSKLQQLFKC